MRTLRCTTCTLEPQVVAHAAEMFVVLSDPAICEYEGMPPPSVERLTEGFRRRENRLTSDCSGQLLNWVVRLPSGALTGYVQATILPTGASCVACEFASRYWRQGLGRASVSTMLAELASAYGVHDLRRDPQDTQASVDGPVDASWVRARQCRAGGAV